METLNLPPLPTTSTKKPKCQVCGKVALNLGVNSNAGLTICLPCDRNNNPYYYDDLARRVKPIITSWRDIKPRLIMLAMKAKFEEDVTPIATIQGTDLLLTCPFEREDILEIAKTMLKEIFGDISKPIPVIPFISWDYKGGEFCRLQFHQLNQYDNKLEWEG